MWAGMMKGVSAVSGTVMQGNKRLNDKRIHPTQKPVELLKWLILNFAKPHYRLLDTNHGSGSLSVALEEILTTWISLDYDTSTLELVACDLDSEYYDKSINWIKRHTSQLKIFA